MRKVTNGRRMSQKTPNMCTINFDLGCALCWAQETEFNVLPFDNNWWLSNGFQRIFVPIYYSKTVKMGVTEHQLLCKWQYSDVEFLMSFMRWGHKCLEMVDSDHCMYVFHLFLCSVPSKWRTDWWLCEYINVSKALCV